MDITTEALRLSINMARERAEVASVNIANVDAPGYRPQRADFSSAIGLLQQASVEPSMEGSRLHDVSMASLKASVHTADPDPAAPVNLDGEVAELETASVDFQAMTTVMSRRFSLMQLALAGKS